MRLSLNMNRVVFSLGPWIIFCVTLTAAEAAAVNPDGKGKFFSRGSIAFTNETIISLRGAPKNVPRLFDIRLFL